MPSHSKLKAILWDNDGVLANTEHLFYQINREFFLELGIELTPQHFFDWFLKDNCGAWHLLKLPDEQIDVLRAERNRRYNQCLQEAHGLEFPGLNRTLSELAKSFRMGIVTSARRADFDVIHQQLNLLPHFEFVVAEGDYAKSKPDPEPYLVGLQKLGLSADQCLVIEDTPRGLQSALAAGIECIVIQNELTAGCEFRGANRVIESHQQLPSTILSIASIQWNGR
jgi:HAD superfamily hydrolase (TIGR01509 family)